MLNFNTLVIKYIARKRARRKLFILGVFWIIPHLLKSFPYECIQVILFQQFKNVF